MIALEAAWEKSTENWMREIRIAERKAYQSGYADAARGQYQPNSLAVEFRRSYREGHNARLNETQETTR